LRIAILVHPGGPERGFVNFADDPERDGLFWYRTGWPDNGAGREIAGALCAASWSGS
jgi:hypothetical protein